jgi:hypothetical protein
MKTMATTLVYSAEQLCLHDGTRRRRPAFEELRANTKERRCGTLPFIGQLDTRAIERLRFSLSFAGLALLLDREQGNRRQDVQTPGPEQAGAADLVRVGNELSIIWLERYALAAVGFNRPSLATLRPSPLLGQARVLVELLDEA